MTITSRRRGEADPLRSAGSGRFACPHCGRGITLAEATVPGHCGAAPCAHASVIGAVHRKEARRREEIDEGRSRLRAGGHVAAAAAARGVPEGRIALGAVPWQGRSVTPPPPERIAALMTHLRAVIAQAFADDPPAEAEHHNDPAPEPDRVATGCATCQGHCCLLGAGRMAFVDVETIQMHRLRLPGLTPDGALAIYEDALPDASTEGGCLFQGTEGCTLPRARRAGICTSFRCWKLRMSVADAPEGAPLLFGGIGDDGTLRKTGLAAGTA